MIDPGKFYQENLPEESRRRIWKGIAARIAPEQKPLLFIPDRSSFLYGIAAAFVLYLAGVGAYHVVQDMIDSSRPAVVRVDNAYQSAIRSLEVAVPAVMSTGQSEPVKERLTSRMKQLQLVDSAIRELKSETGESNISPMSRANLRNLYTMKLKILQQMIEQGEIEP